MHAFYEDPSRCFSEQSKKFSKEINVPLHLARDIWARLHGCAHAHEIEKRIEAKDDEICEALIASKKTLARFPGLIPISIFKTFLSHVYSQHKDHMNGISMDRISSAALKAKGLEGMDVLSSRSKLVAAPLIDRNEAPELMEIMGYLDQSGGCIVRFEEGKEDLESLLKSTLSFAEQRKVEVCLAGFAGWEGGKEVLAKRVRDQRAFDIWTPKRFLELYDQLIEPLRKDFELAFWIGRNRDMVRFALPLIYEAKPDITVRDLVSCFSLQRLLDFVDDISERKSIDLSYFEAIPGLDVERRENGRHWDKAVQHHGYLEMQFRHTMKDIEHHALSEFRLWRQDMKLPINKVRLESYLEKLESIASKMPNYSLMIMDMQNLDVLGSSGDSITSSIRSILRDNKIYGIWSMPGVKTEVTDLC